jgi:formimidoylglutamate deiminase
MPAASLTLHFEQALLPAGWRQNVRVSVADGRIAGIAEDAAPQAGDERHAVALPGLPNLHSHAFQRGMAGLAEQRGAGEDSFWTWRQVMYRFLDRLTPEDVAAIAAQAYVEALESGVTRVGEFHYLHHDRDGAAYADPAAMAAAIAAAAAETGIGLTLLPVFYAHSGFGGAAPTEGQRRFVSTLDGYARLHEACGKAIFGLPDSVLGMAPHSLRAVTEAELAELLALVPEGPAHIHVAEQTAEVDACLAWSGARPVEWLLDHAPVDARWCLVHATHMTGAEARRLAESGAVAGLCPITEANLGDGLFPAEPFLAAGGRFGVGSDSNVLIDAAEELRWLEYGQRLLRRGRNLWPRAPGESCGMALYRGALAGGAQALGADCGIAPGHAADLITLAADHPGLAARVGEALVDGWIFAAGRGAIDTVWRQGAKVVSGGRHHAREAVAARFRSCLARLL